MFETERGAERAIELQMELLLRGVYVFCGVCSIKRRHGVPVLICVSGRAGGRVSQSGGADTE